MEFKLYIKGYGNKIFIPVVTDEITWETERKGAPSKLTFTVIRDEIISFPEGAPVILKTITDDGDEVGLFQGFVFEKKRDREQRIQCIAYDQMRYFKNKHTYKYSGISATTLIRRLANDFELVVGNLDETGYTIPPRLEKDKTIFDMIQTALDITTGQIKKNYVMYDDFGKLSLKDEEDWYVPLLICSKTAENFDYTSSIDKDTFNQVYIYHESTQGGGTIRDSVIQKNETDIGKWGVLQFHERVPDDVNLHERAKQVLEMKSRVSRELNINNAFGDIRVRAGCHLPVQLALGDVNVNYNLRCDKVTHKFTADSHLMDLTLSGHDGMFGED